MKLVHTEQSIQNAKECLKHTVDVYTNDDEAYDGEFEDENDPKNLLEWIHETHIYNASDVKKEIVHQYEKTIRASRAEDLVQKKITELYMDNLKLSKIQLMGLLTSSQV